MGRYDDIIHLPHHVSSTRAHMPMLDRAAQFMPFRALTGYEDAVWETARPTDDKIELTEDEQVLVDAKLQRLADNIARQPQISVTYFQPDEKKSGGAYVTAIGQPKKLDDITGTLILMGGEQILIENILDIQFSAPE